MVTTPSVIHKTLALASPLVIAVCFGSWSAPRVANAAEASGSVPRPTCKALGTKGATALGCGVVDAEGYSTRASRMFRKLRHLYGFGGYFPRTLYVDVSKSTRSLGIFTRARLRPGDVIIELPLGRALWRGTVDLPSLGVILPPNSMLSEEERLILYGAVLLRHAARKEDAGVLTGYGHTLLDDASANSTVFWGIDELQWLRATDAAELTSYFLSRAAYIHSAAPLAATLEEVKQAFVQYHMRHFRLWLGGMPRFPERVDVAMLPGIDLCSPQEGGAKPVFDPTRRVVRLVASTAVDPDSEIFVDFGVRDLTDFLVTRGVFGGHGAGVFLPVPLDSDANGGAKGQLLERLSWAAEVRLLEDEVLDVRTLRLAVMPREEFSAWSIGALIAGAPLAVSRAFRTEVQANAYLATECARRLDATRSTEPVLEEVVEAQLGADSANRLSLVRLYRRALVDSYTRCRTRAVDKLQRLRRWAQRQPAWAQGYVDEAIWRTELVKQPIGESRELRLLPVDPPRHFDPEDVDQRMSYSSIVALVNSRAREFVPYFSELLQAPVVPVIGFADTAKRLEKIKRLAARIVQLKGPACGGVDLSAFDWINELHGAEEVFSTLKYLLPEMGDLVREFVELEQLGEAPAWR